MKSVRERNLETEERKLEKKISEEIVKEIDRRKITEQDSLNAVKKEIAKTYKFKGFLTNIMILSNLSSEEAEKFKKILLTKPARSQSGVSVIAIMTKPIKCPHGKCIYCPGGLNSFFGSVPQSYTGREPATMRAIRANYDSYMQVMNRLEQYIITGHVPQKVELIIMGGTFPSFADKYQKEFISYALKAMNDFSKMFFRGKNKGKNFDFEYFKEFFELPGNVKDRKRTEIIQKKLHEKKGKWDLEKEQKRNETADIRCVAMCIETRPDYCREEHISKMLKLGATRVELGVQTIYNDIHRKIERGHFVKDVIEATRLLKDSFLKVGYHIMPGLPGSDFEKDINIFRELFLNPDFKPDNLKIYPCMVIKGTKLYKMWKSGNYKPLDAKSAAEIIIQGKQFVPEYCRIMRIQRDIPTKFTEAGVEMTNLRQYVDNLMKERRLKCRCIRCREPKDKEIDYESIKIVKRKYEASNGTEVFISAEDVKNDILLGFCRLRIPYNPFRKEILPCSAGIRELHVYGRALPIDKKNENYGSAQHRGFGKKLLSEAERIAQEEFGCKNIYVISGIGVREYYKRLGYERKGVYMFKRI